MYDGEVRQGWCFEGGVNGSSCLFHDVYYLGIFKHYIEEEAGEHVLRDLNFQLGHLLDVFGLLYFVLSVADKSALHHGDYPDVLFDIVDC